MEKLGLSGPKTNEDGTVGAARYDGYVFDFEKNFDVEPTTMFLWNYFWPASLIVITVYLSGIVLGQRLMRHRAAFQLRGCLFLWNVALAVFSALGAWRCTAELIHVLTNYGFTPSVCTVDIGNSFAAFWEEKFALSKVLELGDTAFLVLRKRPVTFLHWFHHATVLSYTWHAVRAHTCAGRWFTWMNYCVHALMYAYYAGTSVLATRPPKWLSAGVTTLQISQMVVGCTVCYITIKETLLGHPCKIELSNMYFCFAMYSTYFVLFVRYFYMAYISKRRVQQQAPAGKVPSKEPHGVHGLNGVVKGKKIHSE